MTRVQTDMREAWADYKVRLTATFETVDQALTEPPPTLPALDTLTTLMQPAATSLPRSGADPRTLDTPATPTTAAEVSASATAVASPARSGTPLIDSDLAPTLAETLAMGEPSRLTGVAPHLIADPLAVGALRAAPSEDARPVLAAPAPAPSAPEEEAPALSPLDRPLPSFGAGLARPLVLRDQPLPTIAEPARGR